MSKERLTDEVHEVLEHGFKVRVPRYGDCDVDGCADCCPHESRHPLCDSSAQYLDGKAD